MSSASRYYKVKLPTEPGASRLNWMVCDLTRLGGGQVCICDKEGDADHIVRLLNQSPERVVGGRS